MQTHYLVTHSGGFHADDLLSTVVLSRLFPDAAVRRSRAPDWIAPGADRIVFDVGGHYDPEKGIFDHHQRDAPLRPDGQPFSSFGLIWKHFGRDYLQSLGATAAAIETVHAEFDRDFVLLVDLLDNGAISPAVAGPLAGMILPELLETLKPMFDETDPQAENRAFQVALGVARIFVEAQIRQRLARLRAETRVREAIRRTGSGRVLELPAAMPFRDEVIRAGAEHLLFVLHPRGEEWSLGGIRRFEDSFELRAELPKHWAGLSGPELEAATGVAGAGFCHKGRFVAVAKTRDAIVELARLAVEDATRSLTSDS